MSIDSPEGDASWFRIVELHEDPVRGSFDEKHLREVHRRIFQDLPHHAPGELRPEARGHVKNRVLEGSGHRYIVPYALRTEMDERLAGTLSDFGGARALQGKDAIECSRAIAKLYGDLDYLHPFAEGNSRTLRVFTAQLARNSGHSLDWNTTNVTPQTRDNLYMARDWAVIHQAYPGLSSKSISSITDRAEYEAYIALGVAQRGDRLSEVIRQSLDRGADPVPGYRVMSRTDLGRHAEQLLPAARHQAEQQAEVSRIQALRSPALVEAHEAARRRYEWVKGPEGPHDFLRAAQQLGATAIVYQHVPGATALDRLEAIAGGLDAERTRATRETAPSPDLAREFLNNKPSDNRSDARFRSAQTFVDTVEAVAISQGRPSEAVTLQIEAARNLAAQHFANGAEISLRRPERTLDIERSSPAARDR